MANENEMKVIEIMKMANNGENIINNVVMASMAYRNGNIVMSYRNNEMAMWRNGVIEIIIMNNNTKHQHRNMASIEIINVSY
jgi:hypothetical protein